MKVETDIIASVTMSPIGWAIIMYVETFKIDVIGMKRIMWRYTDRYLPISKSVFWLLTIPLIEIKGKMSNLQIIFYMTENWMIVLRCFLMIVDGIGYSFWEKFVRMLCVVLFRRFTCEIVFNVYIYVTDQKRFCSFYLYVIYIATIRPLYFLMHWLHLFMQ